MQKTVLITGASSGLGLEFSKLYASKHYDLVIVARREKRLNQIKQELEQKYNINVHVIAKDLSLENVAQEIYAYTVKHQISIDTLINNAGFGDYGNFYENDLDKLNQLMKVNMETLVQLTHYFLPQMMQRKNGNVLNISSVASFCAGPYMALYYASKSFVLSFSQAIGEEVKPYHVQICALCPGPTKTEFEKAAHMNSSRMFQFFKPLSAQKVAQMGYDALQKKKVVCLCGWSTKIMNVGSRLMPRSITRKFARFINVK